MLISSLSVVNAQVCRLSVAGVNRARRVTGSVSAECPSPFHSAPFGNWGVTSNFGPKLDGHQFDGWCHRMEFCDNLGSCGSCSDRWHEWNSCTDHTLFRAPNCTLYNASECTEQVSSTEVNVLGTQTVDLPVSCPFDSDGDGVLDTSGCRDIESYSRGNNFMSVYELDPLGSDELIQTLFFPETVVNLTCDVWGCAAAGSEWVTPIAYQDPSSPPRVHAEMAMVVSFGTFLDTGPSCGAVLSSIFTLSAASFAPEVAADSIVSAFGQNLAPVTEAANEIPLPTSLGGVRVALIGAGGEQPAPLLFVSPEQINFVVPAGFSLGELTALVEGIGGGLRAIGTLQLQAVAPGLFSANADGQGVAAAFAVRVRADGSQNIEPVMSGDPPGQRVPVPIHLGQGVDRVYLALFGTGIRGRTSLSNVTAEMGGQDVPVLFAGPHGEFVALDQVNIGPLPRSLVGSGEVEIALTVDDKTANKVTVAIR